MADPLSVLRPYLQPLTHAIPSIIRDPIAGLITPVCYKTIVEDIDPFSSPECLKLAISKAIGVAIIAASSIVKVPQLLKLVNARSAQGVSFLSYLLETAAYVITLAYNFRSGFPFSTFGETAFIVVQNVAIAVLVLSFTANASSTTRGVPWPAIFVGGVSAAGYALFSETLIPMDTLRMLQMFVTIPLSLASKIPQIIAVHREKSTGQLSAFAIFNYLAGSLARVFTTLAEVDDTLILAGFIGGAVLNAILALQMVLYWDKGSSAKGTRKVAEKKKA